MGDGNPQNNRGIHSNSNSSSNNNKPEWIQHYGLIGKIGEGTYGLVFLARIKSQTNREKSIAIKKFKQSEDGDGVSLTAIREIMLLREISHENIVKLVSVHLNHADMSPNFFNRIADPNFFANLLFCSSYPFSRDLVM